MRIGVVLLVLVIEALCGRSYTAAWRSDLPLWTHARMISPFNPRSQDNYSKALAGAGRFDEAMREAAYVTTLERVRGQ
jgi:hypothetical protein